MANTKTKDWFKLALLAQAALAPDVALAQQGAPPLGTVQPQQQANASSPNPTTTLGEVIVTAQRRAENLERTPVAISVVSAAALVKQNITTEADLPSVAPGLIVRTGATSNEVNYSLRGQSLDQYSSGTPGVLPYVNEVQISTNSGGGSGSTAFYDLQSVQVLKGPQGTLFGRDATGGAVLFTTAKPTNSFGGYVSALAGDYDTQQFEGALNVPIVDDKVLARVAAFYGHQQGYQYNTYDNSHPGTGDREGFRGSLTLKPISRLTDDLVFDYYNIDQTSLASVLYNLQNIPGATPVPTYYSPASGPLFAGYLATHTNPSIDPNGIGSFLNTQKGRGPFKVSVNDATNFLGTNGVVTNNLTYELNANTRYRNIFGYGSLRSYTQGDSDGSPFGIAGDSYRSVAPGLVGPVGSRTNTSIVSDENQITGTALGQNLKYTTGIYYSDVKGYVRIQSTFFDLFGGIPSLNEDVKENITYGVYGQGTYDFSSLTNLHGLSATVGLRYNNEEAKRTDLPLSQDHGDEAAGTPGEFSNNQSKTFENVAWTLGVQEQLNPETLLYVASRRSYKDGGFNSSLAPMNGLSDVGGDGYKTEIITDVEVGSKFQGRLFELPSRLNVAVYNNWVKNSQRAAFASVDGNPSAITVNVPKQEDTGVEADGQVRLTPWFTLGGSVDYTEAKFTDQNVDAFGVIQPFATVPDTPRWTGALYGEATAPITGDLSATVRAEGYSQTSTFYSSSANINTGAKLPSYNIANILLSLDDDRQGWSVIANIKNVFDQTYYIGGIPLAQLLDYNTALPGAPRTVTVQVRYKF